MPQVIDQNISRKISKQKQNSSGSAHDFMAARCAKTLLERVLQSGKLQAKERKNALLLFERNQDIVEGLIDAVEFVDQVPFYQLEQKAVQLTKMLERERYEVVVSNLAFDWIDAGAFVRTLEYVLKPQGEFWFSCYGPLTASHVRSVLSEIDAFPHFNEFYDLRDIGDALLGAGFKDVVLESSVVNLEYDSVDALLADAWRVFGVNTHPDRRKKLTPPGVLKEFNSRVAKVIESEGVFTEEVELLIAHGTKPSFSGLSGVIPVRQR